MTPEEAARRLQSFPKEMDKSVLTAMRSEMKVARKAIVKYVKSRGLGRALWGRGVKKPGKPVFILKSSSYRSRSTGEYVGQFKAQGMLAIMEEGGRTEPHTIKPKGARLLAFLVAGETKFARRVQHPGSRIVHTGNLERALNQAWPGFQRAVDNAVGRAAERAI